MINLIKNAAHTATQRITATAHNALTATKTSLKAFYTALKTGNWLKSPIFWARFLAYAIPLSFLLYVLYINYLPFGYNKTFVIDVGGPDDTRVSEFYLEPSRDLSERKTGTDENGNEYTYRELNGVAYAVFKPNVVLKDAEITVSVEGEGVSIIPPVIDFNPDEVEWDYNWDFTQNKKPAELGLTGSSFPFDEAMHFNGKSKLELPNSADKFEDGPFSVYVEWEPRDDQNNTQQIVGHYNWEIFQNKDNVSFQVGRMNDRNGQIYYVRYPIDAEFFNKRHKLVAVYMPATASSENGYIEIYIDGNIGERAYFGQDIIWQDYNGERNLSMGRSSHVKGISFTGNIFNISLNNFNPISTSNWRISSDETSNYLMFYGKGTINFIEMMIEK
jgi:hypothetical protein